MTLRPNLYWRGCPGTNINGPLGCRVCAASEQRWGILGATRGRTTPISSDMTPLHWVCSLLPCYSKSLGGSCQAAALWFPGSEGTGRSQNRQEQSCKAGILARDPDPPTPSCLYCSCCQYFCSPHLSKSPAEDAARLPHNHSPSPYPDVPLGSLAYAPWGEVPNGLLPRLPQPQLGPVRESEFRTAWRTETPQSPHYQVEGPEGNGQIPRIKPTL